MIRQQQEKYERVKKRYGCNDYFCLERNHLESGPTQENNLNGSSQWRIRNQCFYTNKNTYERVRE